MHLQPYLFVCFFFLALSVFKHTNKDYTDKPAAWCILAVAYQSRLINLVVYKLANYAAILFSPPDQKELGARLGRTSPSSGCSSRSAGTPVLQGTFPPRGDTHVAWGSPRFWPCHPAPPAGPGSAARLHSCAYQPEALLAAGQTDTSHPHAQAAAPPIPHFHNTDVHVLPGSL